MHSKNKGIFITLEGGEGAGKSTQAKLLVESLSKTGREVLLTREPGGCPEAESIRNLVLLSKESRWEPMTEALLMLAARHEHISKKILPALKRGAIVICDRFSDSTYVYQGYAGGIPLPTLRSLSNEVIGDFQPDLTLLFDLPVELSETRCAARGLPQDHMESKGRAFHEKIRAGFLNLASENPERICVIDATQSVEDIQSAVHKALKARLGIGN